MDTRVFLAVVENRDFLLTEYCKFLVGMATGGHIDDLLFWEEGTRRQVWYMRRVLIKKALEGGCSHVLFVDTDVVPPLDVADRLLAHNKALVSGYYCDTTGAPVNRLNGTPYLGTGLEPVDVFSMGLSLIRRDVLEKIEYPEPEPVYKFDADTEFCKLAKSAGSQPYTDFTLRAPQFLLGIY